MGYRIRFLDGRSKEFDYLRGSDLSGAKLRGADLRGADLRGADLRDAKLRGADLSGADLSDADLRGANLRDVDLRDADLRGADLRGADLRDADLRDADLFNTSIISFQLGKHFGFYHEGYLKIGCQGHSLEHWISNVETIGKQNDYTKQEIALYKAQINLIKEHYANQN